MSTLIALLALVVAALYVLIAVIAVPRLASAAGSGERSRPIFLAAAGAGTFLLGCAVTHVVIAIEELTAQDEMSDGGEVWWHIAPHFLQIVGGVAFFVVARKRLSVYVLRKDDPERVAELEGRLSHALDAGHLGAWDVDLVTGRTWHSAQHDRIFGYDAPPPGWGLEMMLGHVDADHRDMVRSALVLTKERPRAEVDCQIVTNVGDPRWVTVTASLLFDGHGGAVRILGTVADITDRHDRDVQRAALEDQLHTWQRAEAVGRLSSGVAHDFNNVLAVVHGWAEVLERDDSLGPEARSHAIAIRSAADHGRRLTQQLVSATRQRSERPENLDVNDTVVGVAGMLQRIIPPTITVHSELADDLPPVSIGPTQLTQILLNLAINARDAMQAGGDLTFTTRSLEDCVAIEVTDTGSGMDADTRARIFEPYFSTKAATSDSGTGLGLSIVQTLVQRAGGEIRVASEIGNGTTFTVALPATADQAPTTRPV